MQLPLYQVDAFTDSLYSGNPAAVVPLSEWLPDDRMQAIALENNLSETAYYCPSAFDGADYDLRWFTPGMEVKLCGHATLASAHVLFEHEGHSRESIRFDTLSGILEVQRSEHGLSMDLPARSLDRCEVPASAAEAIGCEPLEAWIGEGLVLALESEAQLRSLRVDQRAIAALHDYAVLVTAPAEGDGVDFVSRFFAPNAGVPEDPVTGSAHCTLAPFWAERLGKAELRARQLSRRGGAVHCVVQAERERVIVSGNAITYLEGRIAAL